MKRAHLQSHSKTLKKDDKGAAPSFSFENIKKEKEG